MIQIKNIELFVGTKEEFQIAKDKGMKIVCALNRANGFVSHQSIVGWQGRGCNIDNPNYLYKKEGDAIYLNMIDGDDPKYISDEMINPALEFIHTNLNNKHQVFVYCSLGESRSPSIALMYLLENNLIKKTNDTLDLFKKDYYSSYNPKNGNLFYIKKRWGI